MTNDRGVNGHGKGKWHSLRSLWNYKLKRRRLYKISAASRKRNWDR